VKKEKKVRGLIIPQVDEKPEGLTVRSSQRAGGEPRKKQCWARRSKRRFEVNTVTRNPALEQKRPGSRPFSTASHKLSREKRT